MFQLQQRRNLSQVFFTNPQLVLKLVRESSVGKNDTVLEIGPGTGIITRELVKNAGHVVAVEIDPELVRHLCAEFSGTAALTVFGADFLEFQLPSTPYKVFSNIPFHIEGEIIRKLLEADNPPKDMNIVVLKDVARRWAGIPKEGEFSLLHKPWFVFGIRYYFKRTDFQPAPELNTALLRIVKRETPLIPVGEAKEWERFIRGGFGGGRRLKQNLRPFFDKLYLQNLAGKLHFSVFDKPSDLTFNQWQELFQEYKKRMQKVV